MTRGASKLPTGGNDPRTSIRSLDPVDPSAPPPDGSQLLHALLATPRPTRARRRVRLLQLAPVGLAAALIAGVLAVALSGGEDRGEEQEAVAGSGGVGILHYVVRESWGDPRKLVFRYERWQLEDGSQARTISHWEAEGPLEGTTSEEVVTRTQTLSYLPATAHEPARIIRYRASDDFASIPEDPPPFEAPAIGGTPEVGDPRTLPDRAARGDADVTQLPDGTVRDIPVQQFEVGDCAEPAKRERTSDGNGVVTTVPQRATVALARDTHVPVRVTIEPCSEELPAGLETRVLDFVTFEELPHTPGNLEQLELSPHPGVPIKDGIAIDKAEERDEAGPQPSATPVATPDAGAGR